MDAYNKNNKIIRSLYQIPHKPNTSNKKSHTHTSSKFANQLHHMFTKNHYQLGRV